MRILMVVLVLSLAAVAVADPIANIVCEPDSIELDLGPHEWRVEVWYLGGASDTLFAYDMSVEWDGGVVDCVGVVEGDLFDGCSPNGTWFIPDFYPDSLRIWHLNLGYQYPGTLGPGLMFTTFWVGVDTGGSVVDLTLWAARNNENEELTGLYVDDGLITVTATGLSEPMSWSVIKSFYR